jgi:hypothetical protein
MARAAKRLNRAERSPVLRHRLCFAERNVFTAAAVIAIRGAAASAPLQDE